MLASVPLQMPGGVELLAFNLVVALLVGYFIYRDAQGRTDSPELWAVGLAAASLFLSLVGFVLAYVVYYLVVVRD
ncbi:hypothetical protein [Halorarum salinum]|uniref:Uncharacterized protein n=1 Tax=Halorarum salinum TaxID=2743089 RepID=A0A7D5LCP2_9EURY|nr:hypothetical protein [Halobaculum salinum]QLG63287.1 hypothetical protein HUG12_16735 [Halobaculum salinum]